MTPERRQKLERLVCLVLGTLNFCLYAWALCLLAIIFLGGDF